MYQENIMKLIEALTKYFEAAATNGKTWFEVLFSSPAVVALIGALAAFVPVHITSRRSIKDKEKDQIEKALKEFYNPLLFLLKRQKAIYEVFNLSIKREKGDTDDTRTLDLLLSGHGFSPEDMMLLEDIMTIGKRIKELVINNPGYIFSEQLMDQLVKLIEHYDILERAKEGKLTNREEYKGYRFPRQIDELVLNEVKSLNEQLNQNK